MFLKNHIIVFAFLSFIVSPTFANSKIAPSIKGLWDSDSFGAYMEINDSGNKYSIKVTSSRCNESDNGVASLNEERELNFKSGSNKCEITVSFNNNFDEAEVSNSCDVDSSTCNVSGTYKKQQTRANKKDKK
jgi:hypothetical protein